MKIENGEKAWELEDAEERERNAPDLYVLSPRDVRAGIQVGERVELFFWFRGKDQHGAFLQSERLRVSVTEKREDGGAGTLETAPASSDLLAVGDLIRFETRHIFRVHPVAPR